MKSNWLTNAKKCQANFIDLVEICLLENTSHENDLTKGKEKC